MAIGGILTTTTTNIKISQGADNSVAIGNRVSLLAPNTFAWSDFDDLHYGEYLQQPATFTGTTPNTTITRSYNGFAINKPAPTAQSGKIVNLTVGGPLTLLNTPLTDTGGNLLYSGADYSGSLAQSGGCFYYYDNQYRHIMNQSFPGEFRV